MYPIAKNHFMSVDLLVANISRHISLTEDELDLFISLLHSKTLKTGEFLLREGEICRHESFVTKGCLITYYTDKNGLEHIIDFSVEQWWADDLYSFFTQTASKTSIRATEDTEILQLSKNSLERLFVSIPKFERFFRLLFQNAYIAQREQINSTLSESAEERYLSFIRKKPYAEKRFSQKNIASYLGVTPQFLSSLKKKLKQVNVD
jgi:CRP-like cAMP-binding protein